MTGVLSVQRRGGRIDKAWGGNRREISTHRNRAERGSSHIASRPIHQNESEMQKRRFVPVEMTVR
jgi:hypothetical protein